MTLTAEAYPTMHRATACGICGATARVGMMVGTGAGLLENTQLMTGLFGGVAIVAGT